MVTVNQITNSDELEAHRLSWHALWQQTPDATFYQSLDCLHLLSQHLKGDARVRVLFVRHQGRPLGILPLVVASRSTPLGVMRTLTYPFQAAGVPFGPIGPQPAATWLAASRELLGENVRWDAADFCWIAADVDQGRTATALGCHGFVPRTVTRAPMPIVAFRDFPGGWNEYRRSFPASLAGELATRCSGSAGLRWERFRPRGAMRGEGVGRWDLYDACRRLDSATAIFHDEVLDEALYRRAAARGCLDVAILWSGETPIAFLESHLAEGRLIVHRFGWDLAFADCRPWQRLLERVIRDSFARGDVSLLFPPRWAHGADGWPTTSCIGQRYIGHRSISIRGRLLHASRRLLPGVRG